MTLAITLISAGLATMAMCTTACADLLREGAGFIRDWWDVVSTRPNDKNEGTAA